MRSDVLQTQLAQRCAAVAARAELPGGRELPLVEPRDEAELAEVLALARAERLALVPTGLGSKAGWCHPAERADLLVTTRALTGITDYEPGDGTVTARAGTRMAELAAHVARGGHALTPDVAWPDDCTLGGVLAAGQSGFDRLHRGPVRHHVLGMRVLLADGSTTKSGGKLVKNVTGYDLHRLYTGSHGGLCVILSASLRLFPLPERELVLRVPAADEPAALAAAAALLALPLGYTAVLAEQDAASSWTVAAFLGGRDGPVRAQAAELARAFPAAERVEGAEARELQHAARDRERAGGVWPDLVVTAAATRIAAALGALRAALAARGHAVRARVHAGVASAELRLTPPPTAATAAALFEQAARGAFAGARVRWLSAPGDFGPRSATFDRFGPPPAGLARMQRLQSVLDPDGVFARGRFHGGL